jgi:tripartite-type tricarboxylate transporter receptor subunit TctC
MRLRCFARAGLGAWLMAGFAASAQESAESYPSKPVTIVIPFAAGTSIDQAFRLYAKSIGEQTGKQFVMSYAVGAAGSIGAAQVARAAPDGYTLIAATSAMTITPFVYSKLSYDHIADFAPITLLVKQPYVLLAHPSTPFRNAREYIAFARANPGRIDYATAGAGSSTHLPGALLHYMTKTEVTFVHYKAATQRMLDLVAGRVHVTGATLTAGLPHVTSGKLRSLGVASAQRIAQHPAMPTIAEQGVAGYEYTGWNGLAAPARTPAPIIAKLHAMFVAAGKDPELVKAMEATSTELVNGTPEAFRQHIARETERWRAVVQATGLSLEAPAR